MSCWQREWEDTEEAGTFPFSLFSFMWQETSGEESVVSMHFPAVLQGFPGADPAPSTL